MTEHGPNDDHPDGHKKKESRGMHEDSISSHRLEVVPLGPTPDPVFGRWGDLFCAVLGLLLDAGAVLVAVHYFRNGVIPDWLDAHGGRWAWLGAGAVAGFFVFVELTDSLGRFNDAVFDLWLGPRFVIVAPAEEREPR